MAGTVKVGFVGRGAFCSGIPIPIVGEQFVELFTCNVGGESTHKTYPFTVEGTQYDGGIRKLIDVGRQWYKSVAPEQRAYGYYYDRMPIVDKGQYAEMDLFRKVILAGGPSVTDVVRGALANLTAWAALES